MNAKTYRGRTAKEVLARVSRELGPDADIVDRRLLKGEDGNTVVEVTAAPRVPSIAAKETAPGRRRSLFANRVVLWGIGVLAVVIVALVVSAIVLRGGEEAEQILPIEPNRVSIAVLPFTDLSPGGDQEWFCDGISEEIINKLAKVAGLKVIARNSSFHFKGKDVDIGDIGRQLNVSAILDGSVRRSGNKLRISAQLIDVSDKSNIWSDSFDRELQDIFAIQDEIALAVVGVLNVELGVEEQERLAKRYTDDVEIHDLYRTGRFHSDLDTREGLDKGIDYYNLIIEKEPGYAPAYAGLAWNYARLAMDYDPRRSAEYYQKAEAEVLKALEIDEELPEAYTALGYVETHYEWDFSGAESHYKRALALSPGSSFVHTEYCFYLYSMGLRDESIVEGKRAVELDPLYEGAAFILGNAYFWAKRHEEAIASHKKALEINPGNPWANFWIANSYAIMGDSDKALFYLDKCDPDKSKYEWRARILGLLGKYEEGMKYQNQWLKEEGIENVRLGSAALNYVCLGKLDLALDLLERNYNKRGLTGVALLRIPPIPESLGSSPRYKAIMKKVGFPDYDKNPD